MTIDTSRKAFELLKSHIHHQQEEVWLVTLDSRLSFINKTLIFRGTVNHCIIHPRDLIRQICTDNASSFVLAHNHPSGNVQPSTEDVRITKKLSKISRLIEVQIQDHLIISNEIFFSFADHGLL